MKHIFTLNVLTKEIAIHSMAYVTAILVTMAAHAIDTPVLMIAVDTELVRHMKEVRMQVGMLQPQPTVIAMPGGVARHAVCAFAVRVLTQWKQQTLTLHECNALLSELSDHYSGMTIHLIWEPTHLEIFSLVSQQLMNMATNGQLRS
jgi:hypothetical protein